MSSGPTKGQVETIELATKIALLERINHNLLAERKALSERVEKLAARLERYEGRRAPAGSKIRPAGVDDCLPGKITGELRVVAAAIDEAIDMIRQRFVQIGGERDFVYTMVTNGEQTGEAQLASGGRPMVWAVEWEALPLWVDQSWRDGS